MNNQFAPIPATVFSGFLGSGKTTLILHLIEQLQSDQQVIYIKNEIGEENIDGQLLEGKHIKTKELLNGCICCTLVGPFSAAIDEIAAQFKPDRIIIEASGAADPSAIALMIDSHPKLFRDGVISVIDVLNFEGYKDISLTARNQTTFTDLIIFNKVELVSLEKKRAVVGYVRELNTTAPILEAPLGKISPEVVFGVANPNLMRQISTQNHDEEHQHHHHLEMDGLETLAFTLSPDLTPQQVQNFFSNTSCLPPTVFRVKAVVRIDETSCLLLNKVGSRVTFQVIEEPMESTKLVLIGFHIATEEARLRELLAPIISPDAV